MLIETPAPRSRVLVIDDDRSIRRSLEKFLGDLGYAVTTAADGQEGLDALDSVNPDVVLLDLGLPGIDGLEFLERVRGRELRLGDHPALLLAVPASAERLQLVFDRVAVSADGDEGGFAHDRVPLGRALGPTSDIV